MVSVMLTIVTHHVAHKNDAAKKQVDQALVKEYKEWYARPTQERDNGMTS